MKNKQQLFLQASENLNGYLKDFMPSAQRRILLENLKSEEGEFFVKMVNDLTDRIKAMPYTYQTDGQGLDAVVHLHYFRGSVDAWVTERDVGDASEDSAQHQAFGRVDLGYGPELGYISIQELIANKVELDLYWTPKTLKECK